MPNARILSRHPSHAVLRNNAELNFPYSVLLRMGSVTTLKSKKKYDVITNNEEAIRNSSNKWATKSYIFAHLGENEAEKITPVSYRYRLGTGKNELVSSKTRERYVRKQQETLPFPLIGKPIWGSRGRGLVLIKNLEELIAFENSLTDAKSIFSYLFEHYFNFSKEYRIHVNRFDGEFHALRKMLREDAEERWYRNNSNSVWITKENELFKQPENWNTVVKTCQKVLTILGLDFGAFDIIMRKGNKKPSFRILEVNTAPSFGGELVAQRYIEMFKTLIPKLKEESKEGKAKLEKDLSKEVLELLNSYKA